MHSYRNFVFAGQRVGHLMDVQPDDRVLSYLPLAHCTERAYVEASALVNGGIIYFVESLETFADSGASHSPLRYAIAITVFSVLIERVPECA